jgi:hypothetical protein
VNRNKAGFLVALSAGGANAELAEVGLGVEHIDEIMMRLAMRLLQNGHRLGFGGTLGGSKQRLTRFLIETAQSWLDATAARLTDVNQPDTWPLVNWSAWPHYTFVSGRQRAELVGTCHFVDVAPSRVRKTSLKTAVENWESNPRARLYFADALTAMREQSSRESDLRIVWGGRIAGARGWLPGIFEEVASSLALGKPVLILGGFGGCAGVLAEFLADPSAGWPARLSPDACADAERDALCSDSKRQDLQQHFEQSKQRLLDFRSEIHHADHIHRLPSGLWKQAFREENVRRAIHLAATAAGQLSGNE